MSLDDIKRSRPPPARPSTTSSWPSPAVRSAPTSRTGTSCRQLPARDRPDVGARVLQAREPAPTRSRRSSPASGPTSRTRWSGSRSWPRATGTPRSTLRRSQRRLAPGLAEFAAPRTFGLAVRAYAGLRLARSTRGPQPRDLQRAGAAHPALLHGAERSSRWPRWGPSSTAPASTSPSCPTTARCTSDHRLPRVDARRRRPGPALPGRARRAEGGRGRHQEADAHPKKKAGAKS